MSGEWAIRWQQDGELARAVVSALERSAVVPAGKIWVAVRDGQVMLRGHVDSDWQRATAVRLARDLKGVRGVVDSITVAHRVLSAVERAHSQVRGGAGSALYSS